MKKWIDPVIEKIYKLNLNTSKGHRVKALSKGKGSAWNSRRGESLSWIYLKTKPDFYGLGSILDQEGLVMA